MEFNSNKCKYIQFGNVSHEFNYNMNDKNNLLRPLPRDYEEKDLGITFEDNLKFNKHITNIVNRANRLLGMIKRSFSHMDSELFLCLYKSLVRSILDYGSPVWNPSTKKNRQLLENVQRRGTRIVPELRGLSYTQRLEKLNLPSLFYRRRRYDLIQIYKMINGLELINTDKFFLIQ